MRATAVASPGQQLGRALTFPSLVFLAGTLGQGGAERQLYYMLKTLRVAGAEPRLLCLTQGEFWEEPIRRLGVPVKWVGASSSRLQRLIRVVAATRAELPHIIQSAHFFANLYATVAARILGLAEIGAIRNNVTSEVGEDWLGRMSLSQPRWLAANSRAALRTTECLGIEHERCSFLPNVVDTDVFVPAWAKTEGPVTLLAVGRLVEQKRLDRFLRVVKELSARSRCPLRALVVGDGPNRFELERQARETVPGIVQFLGAVKDLVPVYQEADLLVLTSDWEGTPNVLLEAMACGLPVVATDVGGVAEIVREGQTGLLAPTDDEPALAQAALVLVENTEQRRELGEQARRIMELEHSLERLADSLASLYQRVLA